MENERKMSPVIKVIGVGGGGNNAVNRMISDGITSAEFIAANTDMQALYMSNAQTKIQLGEKTTKGLGAGSEPEVGEAAANESLEEIRAVLEGTDLLFITAGMGGGTGTGASPVIAKVAKEMEILTIAVVTKPFETFEGKIRMENANSGVEKLRQFVDAVIIIPNDKVRDFIPKGTSMLKAFQILDDVLRQAIQGISDVIVTPSLINLDFADVRKIFKNKGNAHVGIGRGKGENKLLEATRQAVQSPLLETDIRGATGVIIYIVGGVDLSMEDVATASELVRQVVSPDATIIFGQGIDENMDNEVAVTIAATGFDRKSPVKSLNPYQSATKTENKESLNFDFGNSEYFGKRYGMESPEKTEEPVRPAPPSPEPVREAEEEIPSPRIKKGRPAFLDRWKQKGN